VYRWDSKAPPRFGGPFSAGWESLRMITAAASILTRNLLAGSHTADKNYTASPALPEWFSQAIHVAY
jgi:hypothetical protein